MTKELIKVESSNSEEDAWHILLYISNQIQKKFHIIIVLFPNRSRYGYTFWWYCIISMSPNKMMLVCPNLFHSIERLRINKSSCRDWHNFSWDTFACQSMQLGFCSILSRSAAIRIIRRNYHEKYILTHLLIFKKKNEIRLKKKNRIQVNVLWNCWNFWNFENDMI